MKDIQDEWSNLKRLICMIAEQFGPRCEVVLHDLDRDYDHTIVAIKNGHITNRKIGGSGSNLGLQVLDGKREAGDEYNYITQTKDGRTLRSSTFFLRDDNGRVIGSICINYDISDLMYANEVFQEFLMYPESKKDVEPEIFANNVGEILEHLTNQSTEFIGKDGREMDKEEKIQALEFFDRKGAFLISKAGEHFCKYLNVSKYTLYNYLEIARTRMRESEGKA